MKTKTSKLSRIEEKIAAKNKQTALEKQALENNKLITQYASSPGHKKPTNRREFCEAGVISMTGWILAPTLTQLVGMLEAKAADCPVVDMNGPAPFIHLHYSGGFQTLAAITPRLSGGGALQSHKLLGLGETPTFQAVSKTGAQMIDNGAGRGFFQGLTSTAVATTLANACIVSVPYRDNGDSNDPTYSSIGLVEAAGRAGDKLGMLGTQATRTGINAQNPSFNISATTPLEVDNITDILQAVQFAGALANLSQAQQTSLAKTIKGLSDSQARKLTGLGGGENIMKLVECAVDQNISNVSGGGAALSPRAQDNNNTEPVAGLSALWNNLANDNVANSNGGVVNNLVMASMTMNVLNGNAAGAAYEVGGYDIHNQAGNGRANQEGGAFKIGQTVGRILQTARLMNKKVFIQVTTNGSNDAGGTGTLNDPFTSDSGTYSGLHFFAFDPTGATIPAKAVAPAQIGGLRADGASDNTQFTATVPNGVAAMFYNYCVFSGSEALFEKVLPGQFTAAQKAEMKALAKA